MRSPDRQSSSIGISTIHPILLQGLVDDFFSFGDTGNIIDDNCWLDSDKGSLRDGIRIIGKRPIIFGCRIYKSICIGNRNRKTKGMIDETLFQFFWPNQPLQLTPTRCNGGSSVCINSIGIDRNSVATACLVVIKKPEFINAFVVSIDDGHVLICSTCRSSSLRDGYIDD